MDHKQRERIGVMLQALDELRVKEALLLGEIRAVLDGGQTIAVRARKILEGFGEQWTARYQRPWVHGGAKDMVLAKRLATLLTDEQIVESVAVYLQDVSGFVTRERHPFAVFASQINRWAVAPAESEPLDLLEDPEVARTRRERARARGEQS